MFLLEWLGRGEEETKRFDSGIRGSHSHPVHAGSIVEDLLYFSWTSGALLAAATAAPSRCLIYAANTSG